MSSSCAHRKTPSEKRRGPTRIRQRSGPGLRRVLVEEETPAVRGVLLDADSRGAEPGGGRRVLVWIAENVACDRSPGPGPGPQNPRRFSRSMRPIGAMARFVDDGAMIGGRPAARFPPSLSRLPRGVWGRLARLGLATVYPVRRPRAGRNCQGFLCAALAVSLINAARYPRIELGAGWVGNPCRAESPSDGVARQW